MACGSQIERKVLELMQGIPSAAPMAGASSLSVAFLMTKVDYDRSN